MRIGFIRRVSLIYEYFRLSRHRFIWLLGTLNNTFILLIKSGGTSHV